MDPVREVVITGVGMVSPIGIGKDAFWDSLRAGRSGVRRIPTLVDSPFPVTIGADVAGFDGKLYIQPRKVMKVMCREIQMGFSAATLAMADASLESGKVDPDRFGVVYGSEMFYGEIDEMTQSFVASVDEQGDFSFDKWGPQGMSQLFPLWLLKYLPNMVGCHVGIAQDARGPNNTICLGEASSLLALIEAASVIQRDHADAMIVGGTGSRLNVTPLMYRGALDLTRRNDEPTSASRPFDALRDGMVNGEGAGAIILEERRHAEARGAKILARLLGYARNCEPRLNGQPSQGLALGHALRGALQAARLEPSQVGHVNAHGASTLEGDRSEARAIRASLGDVPVTAPKSFFGNLGAGGGLVEMAASVLGLVHGEVPRTLNYERPDPTCPVNVVHGEPLRGAPPVAVVLNESGTGQAAAVALAAG